MTIRSVLIVCMGNICRSPMAEGLMRHQLGECCPNISITSAGITALVGQPAAQFAQEVILEKKGIDISTHRARQLSQVLLLDTELILTMDQPQQKQIEFNCPTIYGRVHRLGKWTGFDIPDPYRRPKKIFEQTFTLIEESIHEWQSRLWT